MTREDAMFGTLAAAAIVLAGAGEIVPNRPKALEQIARAITAPLSWDALSTAFLCTADPTAPLCDGAPEAQQDAR
jgi:hypothetical protein